MTYCDAFVIFAMPYNVQLYQWRQDRVCVVAGRDSQPVYNEMLLSHALPAGFTIGNMSSPSNTLNEADYSAVMVITFVAAADHGRRR